MYHHFLGFTQLVVISVNIWTEIENPFIAIIMINPRFLDLKPC